MNAERPRDPDAKPGMVARRGAREARDVARGVAAGRQEVGNHHDLPRASGDAPCDRIAEAGRREREMRDGDAPAAESPAQRRRDAGELRVRSALPTAVINEHDGALAHARAHQ